MPVEIQNPLYDHQRIIHEWQPTGGHILTKGLFSGYGAGKTYYGALESFTHAANNYPYPFIGVEPTYGHIRDFMYPAFEELLENHNLTFKYVKNDKNIYVRDKRTNIKANIQMRSGDNPKSLVGTNACGAWIDEPFLQAHEVYTRLSARIRKTGKNTTGRVMLLTGTPEGDTTWAVDELHSKCELVESRTTVARGMDIPIDIFASKDGRIKYIETSSYVNESNPDDYVEDMLSRLTKEQAESYVFGRTTNLTSGRCYYAWDEARNTEPCTLDYGMPVDISVDFNYGEKWMCWNISQQKAGNVYVRYALGRPNMNTIGMCQYLEEVLLAYSADNGNPGQMPAKLVFYGDYGGNRKSSNADRTDYELIKQYFRSKVNYLDVRVKSNPLVKRRIQNVNAALCNAFDQARLFLHPGEDTKILRGDFKHVAWDKNKAVEDQSNPKLTHSSSALGYYISYIMPIETIKSRRS